MAERQWILSSHWVQGCLVLLHARGGLAANVPDAARHVYFEATAMIIGLISLGHYIETKAKSNTNRSLQALLNLQPQQATLVTEQGDQSIAVADIQLGMSLRIKPESKSLSME